MLFLFLASAFSERSFKIEGDSFMMDGKPFRYISGSFHYFRQLPSQWENTLKKMANGGLNTIQTYVAWNLHEPTKGNYNFEGMADLDKFLDLCEKLGLYVILRPGPFICAEWEFGGLPYWLYRDGVGILRSSDEVYMKHVTEWLTYLYKRVAKRMYHNGGNIIMVQIENEYGAYYACDKVYLQTLCEIAKQNLGEETVLFTVDNPFTFMVKCGAIPELAHVGIDFGTGVDPKGPMEIMQKYNGHGPYINPEYYTGWMDHWGEKHHTVSAEEIATYLDQQLSLNFSVNFYMYFGGTNFAYWNGATGDRIFYLAMPTSYDYDAPLSEAADMTYKYEVLRETIRKYNPDIPTYEVYNTTKRSYGSVTFTQGKSLYDALPDIGKKTVQADYPQTFEELDQAYGFVLYESNIAEGGKFVCEGIHDYGTIMTNKKISHSYLRFPDADVHVDAGELDILVENCGRTNFGWDFVDRKGLLNNVTVNKKMVTDWTMTSIPLDNIHDVKFTSSELPTGVPAFYRGTFTVDEVADTYLNPTGFKKGIAFINGFNIGRYWLKKPQLTLYVPQEILVQGENEIILFETGQIDSVGPVTFDDKPQIDIQ
ncbi:Beta-galactosidase [Tritrichomonas foetus]|uniref:Beta-galactosidase n=1 Tax=Tritrichomonas foetus TaxID=1144522 RepID=A0A1J4J5A7_9EUKA|nr:Beta-galactosidase [Tritrichomonas foetus]|eukprot:OHS93327.1 Beta-galactosidase [Tritrichomonas foetus]